MLSVDFMHDALSRKTLIKHVQNKNYYCRQGQKRLLAQAIAHYTKMLRADILVQPIVVKDAPDTEDEERKRLEGKRILQKIEPKDMLIALHETGQSMDSRGFARFLRPVLEAPGQQCSFVLGGALGLSPEVLKAASMHLSLSPLTMPHELALVVLYEQLFRAMTIMNQRTYHY